MSGYTSLLYHTHNITIIIVIIINKQISVDNNIRHKQLLLRNNTLQADSRRSQVLKCCHEW